MKITILDADLGASKAASELNLSKLIITEKEKRTNCNAWNFDNYTNRIHEYRSIKPDHLDSIEFETDILFAKTRPTAYGKNAAIRKHMKGHKPKYVVIVTTAKSRTKLQKAFEGFEEQYYSDFYKLNTACFGLPIYDAVEVLIMTRSDQKPFIIDDTMQEQFTPIKTIMHTFVPMKYLSPHQSYFIYPTNTCKGVKRIALMKDKNGKIKGHNRHNRIYDPEYMGIGIRSDCNGCAATGIYMTEQGIRRLTHIEAAAAVGLEDVDIKGGDDFRIKFIADATPYPIAKHILKAIIENISLYDNL